MPDNTTVFGWPYPLSSDLVRDGAEAIQDLAEAVETTLTGTILQVVSTAKTDTFSTSSSTFTDITGLSVSITPSNASNKVLVLWSGVMSGSNAPNIRIARGGTAIFVGDAAGTRTQTTQWAFDGEPFPMGGSFLDSPASTSSLTYTLQMRRAQTSGTVYIGRSPADNDDTYHARAASSITVMEVSA